MGFLLNLIDSWPVTAKLRQGLVGAKTILVATTAIGAFLTAFCATLIGFSEHTITLTTCFTQASVEFGALGLALGQLGLHAQASRNQLPQPDPNAIPMAAVPVSTLVKGQGHDGLIPPTQEG